MVDIDGSYTTGCGYKVTQHYHVCFMIKGVIKKIKGLVSVDL